MTKKECRKLAQGVINDQCMAIMNMEDNTRTITERQLRSCNAFVRETEKAYYLFSYRTHVATIVKTTFDCADFLRYVYGYTATSAQHIAKFRRDYGAIATYTYRDI